MRIGLLRTATVAAAITATALAGGVLAPSASAATATVKSGTTTITTAPGLATALLQQQVVAGAVPITSNKVSYVNGDLQVRFTFAVRGGSYDPAVNQGEVDHGGALVFVNLSNGKKVVLKRLQLSRTGSELRAQVGSDPTLVPVLDLAFGSGTSTTTGKTTTIAGVPATLTQFAADSLNEGLGVPTEVFFSGTAFGTLNSTFTTR